MLKNIKEYSNLEIATYFHIPTIYMIQKYLSDTGVVF
jgi:hypothetical protein